jgi:hypothetical protein
MDECLKCHSRCIIAAPIEELKSKSEQGYYAKREREYHVTSLLGCPRKAVLGRFCNEYAPPSNIWKMQMGTLGHELMERYPQGKGESEKLLKYRYYIELDGVKHRCMVVGRFDWYSHTSLRIHDYKFVSTTDYIPNQKHYEQMAVYYIIGMKCGAFKPEDVSGAQIDYVEVTTGRFFPHRAESELFDKCVKDMEDYIPKMLTHYLEGELKDVVPKGDPRKKECAYCPPEFKAFCEQGGTGKNLNGMDLKTAKIMIIAYRRDNTPSDDEE